MRRGKAKPGASPRTRACGWSACTPSGPARTTCCSTRPDFGLTLLGVALFHRHTLAIALLGLVAVTAYKTLYAGFDGQTPKGPEDQVDALLQLYDRCKGAVGK